MELLAYWKVIRKRWALILAIGLLGVGAAIFIEVRQAPQYRTTTTLFLNPAAANPLLPYQATKTVQSVANTYIEFMRTRSFADLVAQQSGLALSSEQVILALAAQYIPDTQFFRITATFTDPAAAQIIANTAAQTLIAENAALQQAEQAQIQSQRNQDPERQQLTELRDALRDELTLHSDRITEIRDQVTNLELRSPSERNDERLTDLRTELVSLQQVRTETLNSLAQVQSAMVVGIGSSNTTDTAVIVDAAPLPAFAVPRPFVRTVLVWLVFGLAVGVALAMGLEYLDYTVRSPEDLENAYGLPVQGVVGVVTGRRNRVEGQADPSYQLTASDPRGPIAESIRSLRTSVQIASLTRPLRSLLVTSAGPAEGKTFVASNLAVSMAQNGNTVILVDLDLRKPSLHSAFGLPREPGFTNLVLGHEADILAAIQPQLNTIVQRARNSEFLQRQAVLVGEEQASKLSLAHIKNLLRSVETDDFAVKALIADVRRRIEQSDDLSGFLQPTDVPNLRLLSCGTIPPHPSELLGSVRAAQVMERLKDFADIVIFDSPPAAIVTDAVIMAPRADAILQVVHAGNTRIDLMRRCRAIIEKANGQLLGPVLNQVRLSDMGSYSYYYYYGYGQKTNGHRSGKREKLVESLQHQWQNGKSEPNGSPTERE
jgi:capsular exopolysaccharide synthesis family protein